MDPPGAARSSPPSEGFLSDFSFFWERQYGTFPDLITKPVLTPEGLFRILVTAAERFLSGDTAVDFCFWIASEKQDDVGPYLPARAEGSLRAYHDRVETQLAGADYTLLLADIHLYNDEFWSAAHHFLKPLFRHTGLPRGWVDTSAFLGRYRRTPFGVHKGHMSVLTFPVEGVKRFRLWSTDYIARHPELKGLREYDGHLGESTLIEGGVGDAMYWPSRVWHIAEGGGEFTAAWNFGFWLNPLEDHALQHVLGMTGRFLSEAGAGDDDEATFPFDSSRVQEMARVLPRSWRATADAPRRFCAGPVIEEGLAMEWLRTISALGFKKVPAPKPTSCLQIHDMIEVMQDSAFFYVPLDDERVAIAASGQVFTITANPTILGVLDRLRAGVSMRVREILADCACARPSGDLTGEAGGDEVMGLLQLLERIRAVRVAGAGLP